MRLSDFDNGAVQAIRQMTVQRVSEEAGHASLPALYEGLLSVEFRLLQVVGRGPRLTSSRDVGSRETAYLESHYGDRGHTHRATYRLREPRSAAREFIARVAAQPLVRRIPSSGLLLTDRIDPKVAQYLACIGWITKSWGRSRRGGSFLALFRRLSRTAAHAESLLLDAAVNATASEPDRAETFDTGPFAATMSGYPPNWVQRFHLETVRRLEQLARQG